MQKDYKKSIVVLFMLCAASVFGQQNYLKKIKNHLNKNASAKQITGDFTDLQVTNHYFSKSLDVEHVYVSQKVKGISIFRASGNFAFKKGEIVYAAKNFQSNIYERINTSTPKLSAVEAITSAANQLQLPMAKKTTVLEGRGSKELVLNSPSVSTNKIPARLVYMPTKNEDLRLAWDIVLKVPQGKHWWSLRVDAVSGKILEKNDLILHCSFTENAYQKIPSQKTHDTHSHAQDSFVYANHTSAQTLAAAGASYQVFPFPIESPTFGAREIVTNPADPTASPYGWHDIDGVAGAEYTITQGNNVHASEDRNGDEIPGYAPDGGTDLSFLFPLDTNQDPKGYQDAAITNLFYINNMMHDIWYQYGFDEEAGNFQQMNYSGKGIGKDYVRAFAQSKADGGPGNNANFSTPVDGTNPVMNMFTWSPSRNPDILRIDSGSLQGNLYQGTFAGFGPSLSDTGVTGELVLLEDSNAGSASTDPNDACDPVVNPAELVGKIAVLRRGTCDFTAKVKKAQNAGAIAVVVINNVAGLIKMGGDDTTINIPSILVEMTTGESILSALKKGETISVTIKNLGPFEMDGDFDNGIIAHEYGHGISTRLAGNPDISVCLYNDEAMGEGWSDFFAYVLTIEPGDVGTDARGIGTYVTNQAVDGLGIRQHRYSTDMKVNSFTYGDVRSQHYMKDGEQVVSVHGVGSIWATMLWDLTWAFVDKYGFDPDLYHGTGGNNMVMQLVIDGLKLQPCGPGFVDGRDAILQADKNLYGGANQKLIWQVFADRGLGFSAEQGLATSIYDQKEAFDMPKGLATEDFEPSDKIFRVYPNPIIKDVLTIRAAGLTGELQINLYDINGRKVLEQTKEMSQSIRINTSQLSSGVYILKLNANGKKQTEKLIIQ